MSYKIPRDPKWCRYCRSNGANGMKYEDALKALPKIYDNIKEK